MLHKIGLYKFKFNYKRKKIGTVSDKNPFVQIILVFLLFVIFSISNNGAHICASTSTIFELYQEIKNKLEIMIFFFFEASTEINSILSFVFVY